MRRILILLVLMAAGFWIAWPAFSGYRIHAALKAGDAATLNGTIDFASVRASLRPIVAKEVEKRLAEQLTASGPGGAALRGEITKQLLPAAVEGVLVGLVTPESAIRLYRDGGALRDGLTRLISEQSAKAGGLDKLAGAGGLERVLGGKKSPVTDITDRADGAKPQQPAPAQGFGPGNIKSFAFNGPLAMRIGVAGDAAATEPELTAELSFRGLDWKLTGLEPRL